MPKRKVIITIDIELMAEVAAIAKKERRSISSMIEVLIERGLLTV